MEFNIIRQIFSSFIVKFAEIIIVTGADNGLIPRESYPAPEVDEAVNFTLNHILYPIYPAKKRSRQMDISF